MSQYRFKVEPGAEVFVGDRRYLITALLDVYTVLLMRRLSRRSTTWKTGSD